MEHLVFGISSINFEQNVGITKENCAPNHLMTETEEHTNGNGFSIVMEPEVDVCDFDSLPPVSICHFERLAMNASVSTEETLNISEATNLSSSNDSDAEDKTYSPGGKEMIARRLLPSRASKESNLLSKSKRRSIMKPTKRVNKSCSDFSSLRPADIKKIYLNKKLTNFHPAKLETIFEEPKTEANGAESQVRFIGARKLKRSLSFCDGITTNKTLIKQRRLKIKKSFGRRFALKKISLDDFLHRLNSSFESDSMGEEEEEDHEEPQQSNETESKPTSSVEEMDAEDTKHTLPSVEPKNEAEVIGSEHLLPLPDVDSLIIKSNSFYQPPSQPVNLSTQI